MITLIVSVLTAIFGFIIFFLFSRKNKKEKDLLNVDDTMKNQYKVNIDKHSNISKHIQKRLEEIEKTKTSKIQEIEKTNSNVSDKDIEEFMNKYDGGKPRSR